MKSLFVETWKHSDARGLFDLLLMLYILNWIPCSTPKLNLFLVIIPAQAVSIDFMCMCTIPFDKEIGYVQMHPVGFCNAIRRAQVYVGFRVPIPDFDGPSQALLSQLIAQVLQPLFVQTWNHSDAPGMFVGCLICCWSRCTFWIWFPVRQP